MSEHDRNHGAEVPVADAEEQRHPVAPDDAATPEIPAPTAEADEADVWEQSHEVPLDDDEPQTT